MRQTVSEANKYLRQTVKSVEAGGVATLAQAMEHPGTLQEVHITTLDAADAEIPAAAGRSKGVKLPTRIETKKLVIIGKFPVATKAEYDALSDAMKDKAVILDVNECPIGSEVKAVECNALGVPVDAHMWIMGADGWKGGSSSTLNPDGSTSFAGPVEARTIQSVTVQRKVDAVVKNIEQSGYGAIRNSADRTHQHNAVVVPCVGGGYTILNWNTATLGIVSLRLALAPTLKHDGVGLTWVNAKFAGSAGVTVPASTSETNNNRVPGSVTCDPVTFPADVVRTDDPTSPYRIIVARIETSEAWTLQANVIGDGYAQNTAHECQECFGAVSNAGGFEGAVGVGDGGASWYLWIPGFFSITPQASVPSIQAHGDSIMRQGWLFDAQKALAAEGIRFPVASSAAGQSNKASSYARFLAERGIGRSSMYLWQAYSPNDNADTLVCIANGYKYTRLVLDDLWANDITPIIVLFPTIGANNAAKQNAWIGMRNWLTSLDAAKKIHFLDTSALSDPTTPWFYLPAMTSDGTHLSAAGVAVCAAALAKVIRLHV